MTESQGWSEQLVAGEDGAVYAIPADALASFRLSPEQLAERVTAARATDDAEVQGYHHAGGYTVRPGDNLWQIAQRLYGDGRYWVYLYSANADQIHNPNLIYAGQTLRLL